MTSKHYLVFAAIAVAGALVGAYWQKNHPIF